MKTHGLLVGTTLALVAATGCGGTVVFEEDGNEGGGGFGSTTTNVGPGGGDGPTTSTNTTVGPTSTSSGVVGCGTFADDLGFTGECRGCLDNQCCDALLGCDAGTPCWDCYFLGENCEAGQPAADVFFNCYIGSCNLECNGSNCGPGEFQCVESGECIPERWTCDGGFDCVDGSDEFCGGCGPGDFQCFDSGECIPGEWQCNGTVECQDATDEQFCEGFGICDSGLSTDEPQLDQCLGDFCCFEFNECTDFGADVDGCYECLGNQGGPQCQSALDCAFSSPCLDQPREGICGTGLTTGEQQFDACINQNCCPEFDLCTDDGQDIEQCLSCFEQGQGPLCDPAITCMQENCGG